MAQTYTYDSNGIDMKYAIFGRGTKPLIVIPGVSIKHVTDNADAVEKQFSLLLENFRIYLFDRRDRISAGYTIRQMTDDLAKVLGSLGIKKANIYGVSQGGMISLLLAAYYPDLVEKVMVVSTSPFMPEETKNIFRKWADLSIKDTIKDLSANYTDLIYSPTTLASFRDTIINGNLDSSEEDLEHFKVLCQALVDWDDRDYLHKIKAKVLSIGCEGDKIFGTDLAQKIAEETNGECFIYPNEFGHGVFDEAPDMIKRIYDFFR